MNADSEQMHTLKTSLVIKNKNKSKKLISCLSFLPCLDFERNDLIDDNYDNLDKIPTSKSTGMAYPYSVRQVSMVKNQAGFYESFFLLAKFLLF